MCAVTIADRHRGRLNTASHPPPPSVGVEQAKPNAILVQMGCEGEGAPTRANVKSHLQKYRLWLLKRERGEPLLGHSLGHRDVAAGPVTAR